MRSCEACGEPLPSSAHPKRRFCNDSCRKRRGSAKVVAFRAGGQAAGTVEQSTSAALEAAGRAGTPAGAAAMVLAVRIDLNADTGSAMAAMVKELRSTMADALAGVPEEPDKVDEIRAQREKRLQRAGS